MALETLCSGNSTPSRRWELEAFWENVLRCALKHLFELSSIHVHPAPPRADIEKGQAGLSCQFGWPSSLIIIILMKSNVSVADVFSPGTQRQSHKQDKKKKALNLLPDCVRVPLRVDMHASCQPLGESFRRNHLANCFE
jgi:hypothetical protein